MKYIEEYLMTIIAKPVIKNQFWILRDADEKVGNIEANGDGFKVKINNDVQQFKTINMVKQRTGINFESPVAKKTLVLDHVHGYPAGCKAYNPLYEIKLHLPLFTKTKKSKSWYAAGWYRIKQGKRWEVVQSPKLITLKRYPNFGPFLTKEQAK